MVSIFPIYGVRPSSYITDIYDNKQQSKDKTWTQMGGGGGGEQL